VFYTLNAYNIVGRDSSVGTATRFRLDGPVGGEIFRTRPEWPCSPPSLLYNGYRVFPGVKRPGCGVTTHPQLLPKLKKPYVHVLTLWAFMAGYERIVPLPLPFIFYST